MQRKGLASALRFDYKTPELCRTFRAQTIENNFAAPKITQKYSTSLS